MHPLTPQDVTQKLQRFMGLPNVPAPMAVALAVQLEVKAPADLRPEQRQRLTAVRARAEEVDLILNARARPSGASRRAARLDAATAWSALQSALHAFAVLPASISPIGAQAASVEQRLFHGATPFIQLSAPACWAQSKRFLQRIDEEGMAAEMAAVGVGLMLDNARRAVAVLGDVAGCTKPVERPSADELIEARDRFRAAVASYARAMAYDVEEGDEVSVARFERAVGPIDEARAAKRAGTDSPTEGDLPPVDTPSSR